MKNAEKMNGKREFFGKSVCFILLFSPKWGILLILFTEKNQDGIKWAKVLRRD
jgi:hypothetical protein